MIRLTYVHRRLPSLSHEEFQNYWQEKHAPLIAKHASALACQKYVQVHVLDDPLNTALREQRGALEPYDGATEMWWNSREDLIKSTSTPEGKQALDELLEDEKNFIDFDNSSLWMAYEQPQVNPTPETLVAHSTSPYVRIFYCYRHLASMSLQQAQQYWSMTHGPWVRKHAHAGSVLRYIQVHMLEDAFADKMRAARGGMDDTFTGHAALWWNHSELIATLESAEGQQAFAAFLSDERNFIDFSRSALWLAKEHVVVDT